MPTKLEESVSGAAELVFPDDSDGTYSLRERSVYDADEVRVELETDIPEYGSWLPVTDEETGNEAWLIAPSQLRAALVEDDIQTGERFEIVTMQKTGREQSDPYRVEIRFPDRDADPAQASIGEV